MKWLILVGALLLTGCLEPEVERTEPLHAKKLIESLQYIKAKNGLCFGVTTVSRKNTNGVVAMNNIVVNVNCDEAGLNKTRKR